MSIGQRIREERQKLGLSQTAFGALGGVGKTTQILYEADERVPDSDYLIAIAKKGADPIYVLLGKRPNEIVEDSMNWNLLLDIFEAIEQWAMQRKKRTPRSTKLALAKLFFLQFQERGKVDPKLIEGHLRLHG